MSQYYNLSIRARVAYSILCLENFVKKLKYSFDDWKFFLDELWKYANSDLGIWQFRISEMIPFSICEKIDFSLKGCEYITEIEHNKLQNLYNYTSKDILDIINLIYDLGTVELFIPITNYSPRTLKYLEEIIIIIKKNQIALPNLTLFSRYTIYENQGLGREFTRDELVENN